MGNGSLRFKDNSGNVISFISGSGTDIVISGGTLNLLGMTEVALGNVTISGSTLVNGTQGNQGPQGMNGFQGPTGLQGSTGSQGNQGPTGLQGSTGSQGNQGPNGLQGNQGPTGLQGTQGFQGRQGPQGNQGPTGLQGTTGAQGNQGPQGNQGNQGPQGNQGTTGLQGTTGAQGNQGLQGTTGAQGTQGNQGPTGLQGSTGSQGNQGPTGLQGNQGPTGLQGSTGSQGFQGFQGFQGTQGIQGTTGASAGITSYTNPDDNRVLTSVSSTSINAEANLIFDGTNLGIGTTNTWAKFVVNNGTNLNLAIKLGQTDPTAMMLNAHNDAVTANIPMEFRATKFNFELGNVGIGTVSPAEKLVVAGAIMSTSGITGHGANRTTISQEGANGAFWQSYGANTTTAGIFQLRQASSDFSIQRVPLYIDASGNVGIGTTSPSVKLDIQGTRTAQLTLLKLSTNNLSSANGDEISMDFKRGDTYFSGRISGYINDFTNYDGGLKFYTAPLGVLGTTPTMTLTKDGNVGIGTTSPSQKLHINSGNLLMDGTFSGVLMNPGTGAGSLTITRNGTFINNVQQIDPPYTDNVGGASGGGAQIQLLKNELTFSTFPTTASAGNLITLTERMRITSIGVGIGTTSPGAQLSIFDTNNSRGYQMSFGYGTTETFRLGNSNTTGKFIFTQLNNSNGFRFNSSAPNSQGIIFDINTSQFVVNGDTGRVGIGRTPTTNILEIEGNASKTTAGDWLANSDLTIKTEIHTIDGALDRINKVRLVSFKYKDGYKLLNPSIEDKFYQNVIAQEYQEIYPDYVYQSGDIFEDKNILQVDTNPMYIDAVASIQQLSAQIDILKQEIINLKNN